MVEPIENLYFNWLCAKVIYIRNHSPSLTYWKLFKILHTTEFVWLLSGDDNRAEDGLELRTEFILEADIPDDPEWRVNPGCSLLEMFIAFSRRAEFMTEQSAQDWFWEFMDNLGLKEFNDGSDIPDYEVEEILDRFIWRTYELNGNGGMLPIDRPKQDQRGIEIWFQFCDYLVDHDRLL
ncbi:MAG: hypothetical protein ABWY25_09635 [Paenisporosarcina sp.]